MHIGVTVCGVVPSHLVDNVFAKAQVGRGSFTLTEEDGTTEIAIDPADCSQGYDRGVAIGSRVKKAIEQLLREQVLAA